jgi:hypothetical protein
MSKATIIKLIIYYSHLNGINPNVALAVAEHESNFNPNAIGALLEIGIFQIRPEFSKLSKAELKKPEKNIKEGIRLLKVARDKCIHQKKNEWLVCYNYGQTNALRVKHPELWPYVTKVNKIIASNK